MNIKFTPADFSRFLLIASALLSALVSFLVVYVTLGVPDNSFPLQIMGFKAPDPSSIPASSAQTSTSPSFSFIRPSKPEKAPLFEFSDRNGVKRTLGDFRGKTILLNLWATWCIPCREEMPSLDRLQKDMGSDKFQVIALSLDRAGKQVAEKFFSEIKVQNLDLYIDSSMKAGNALRAVGMPTTILIDKEGNEIGRLPGPAEWDSPGPKALIKEALN